MRRNERKRKEGGKKKGVEKGERSSRMSDSRDATPDIGPCGNFARAQKRIMHRKYSSRRYHRERDTVPKPARANSHARRP